MPGKHNDDTKLLGFYAHKGLASRVEEQRKKDGIGKSQFLRDAVVEHMERLGVKIPEKYKRAPDRSGKGGPRKQSEKAMVTKSGFPLSSKVASSLESGESSALELVQHPPQESSPSSGAAEPTAHKLRPTHGIDRRSKGQPAPPSEAPKQS